MAWFDTPTEHNRTSARSRHVLRCSPPSFHQSSPAHKTSSQRAAHRGLLLGADEGQDVEIGDRVDD
eukprot:8252189-Pyramimonas_sp.AAC.1